MHVIVRRMMTVGAAGLLVIMLMLAGAGHAQEDPTPQPTPTQPPVAALPQFGTFTQQCGNGVHAPGPDFAASGLILTTFSRDAMWAIDLDRNMRYPYPNTRPCGPNCRPSPDRRTLLYVSSETATYWTMNVDGTLRQSVFPYYLSELDWWDTDHWLAWPTAGMPAIYPLGISPVEADPVRLADYDVFSIQPGGLFGLRLVPGEGEWPILDLVDLQSGEARPLLEVQPYSGGVYWSPDGSRLAYVGQGVYDSGVDHRGAELFLLDLTDPALPEAVRVTDLSTQYGATRITGWQASRAVSWSRDGRYLAFWVLEVIGPDMEANVGNAVLHVLDTQTGEVVVYCGLALTASGPLLPAPVWSPEGRYIAFGADQPDDDRPAIMYVLDRENGDYIEVSEGMYAAYGTYDPVMWGQR